MPVAASMTNAARVHTSGPSCCSSTPLSAVCWRPWKMLHRHAGPQQLWGWRRKHEPGGGGSPTASQVESDFAAAALRAPRCSLSQRCSSTPWGSQTLPHLIAKAAAGAHSCNTFKAGQWPHSEISTLKPFLQQRTLLSLSTPADDRPWRTPAPAPAHAESGRLGHATAWHWSPAPTGPAAAAARPPRQHANMP